MTHYLDEPFEDECYPPELVKRINGLLNDRSLDAISMWYQICEAVHTMYSSKENPNFQGFAYQLSLETAPREYLLSIIGHRRIFGFRELLSQFGMSIPCINEQT